MNPAVKLAVASTDNHIRKAMRAAEGSVLPIWAGVNNTSAHQFLLYLHKYLTRDDCFMAVFHVVLGNKTVVLDSLFREEINGIGLLQKGIADIFFISKVEIDAQCLILLGFSALYRSLWCLVGV